MEHRLSVGSVLAGLTLAAVLSLGTVASAAATVSYDPPTDSGGGQGSSPVLKCLKLRTCSPR